MAGHYQVNEQLIIDTHGADVIDPMYDLFRFTIEQMSKDVPVLLERDFNIPELDILQTEINNLRVIKSKTLKLEYDVATSK